MEGGGEDSQPPLDQYLDEEFPSIVVSIHTDLVELYEKLTFGATVDIGKYRSEHPSLVRVLLSVNQIFENVERQYKTLVRDEGSWKSAITQLYEQNQKRATINSPRELSTRLMLLFVGTINAQQESFRANMEDIQRITSMVTDTYLGMSDEEIESQREKEKTESYIPIEHTEHYTEAMEEAEKGLKYVFSSHELTKYHDLVRNLYQRSEQ